MTLHSAIRIPHSALPQRRKPRWLKARIACGEGYREVKALVERHRLHTVCSSARCPNIGTCWSNRTATFMILGNICTRPCRFCAVEHGRPNALDEDEPSRVAEAVNHLGLDYAVITSVTRDDLADGGASVFAETINHIRRLRPDCRVEVLIPDFSGSLGAVDTVLTAASNVLNHNVETVPRLYPEVRPRSSWDRSVRILEHAKRNGFLTKSGLMLGLSETREELLLALAQLAQAGTDILTLGQYLAPTTDHYPVARYIPPDEFEEIRLDALSFGFRVVVSGPLVRSSYRAKEAHQSCLTSWAA